MFATILAIALAMLPAGEAPSPRAAAIAGSPFRESVSFRVELDQPLTVAGQATYYAKDLMEAVYRNRLAYGHVQPCPACLDYVAVPDCSALGRRVWLRHAGELTGPYLVVDCAAARDLPTVQARRIVVEVSWPLSRLWQMAGPIPIEVLYPEEE